MSTTHARGNYKAELDRLAAERWRTSVRGRRFAEIDKSLPSKKYDALIAGLSRRHANLLLQLRTNHVPLQTYLARIGKVLSPTCPTCGEAAETVAHYLLTCRRYLAPRHTLRLAVSGPLSLRSTLGNPKARTAVLDFVEATGRFPTYSTQPP